MKINDLISKQEAIDEIKAFQEQVTVSSSSDWIGGMDEGYDQAVSVIELMDTVEAIPIKWILWYIQEYPYMTASSMLHYWSMDQALERKEE